MSCAAGNFFASLPSCMIVKHPFHPPITWRNRGHSLARGRQQDHSPGIYKRRHCHNYHRRHSHYSAKERKRSRKHLSFVHKCSNRRTRRRLDRKCSTICRWPGRQLATRTASPRALSSAAVWAPSRALSSAAAWAPSSGEEPQPGRSSSRAGTRACCGMLGRVVTKILHD